jgi:hypothetical protein
MAGSNGATGGPADWSGWYERYVTNAAGQSARALALYQELLARVSRGELSPNSLQDLLSVFVQARGAPYSAELADVSMRFFQGLIDLSTTYAFEVVESMTPGAMPTVRPSAPPPPLDVGDWPRWFQHLGEYANEQSGDVAQAYQAVLDRVAAGELPPSRVQEAWSQYLQRKLPEHLQKLFALCFELLNSLEDVRNRYAEDYMSGVLTTAPAEEEPALFVIDLVAPLGEVVSTSLSVANTRDEASTVRCRVTDVRRADGVGPGFVPNVSVAPDECELAPGQETTMLVTLVVDNDAYEIGPVYVGALEVSGHDDTPLEVPLRIRATDRHAGNGA